jgi:hypothetical protein
MEYGKACMRAASDSTELCPGAIFTRLLQRLKTVIAAKYLTRATLGPGAQFGGPIAAKLAVFATRGRLEVLLLTLLRIVNETTVKFGGDTLQVETKERWRELCERIVHEQDPIRFEAAIRELLQVLEERDRQQRNATVPMSELQAKLPTAVAWDS